MSLVLEGEKAKSAVKTLKVSEGILVINIQGEITELNPTAEHVVGLNAEVLGKVVYDHLILFNTSGSQIPSEQHPAYVALRDSIVVEDTYIVHKQAVDPITVAIVATPVKQGDSIIAVVLVIKDITKEKETDRLKTEFISLASHQLRTPLSAIKWFTEMLTNGDAGALSTEQVDFVQNIYDSTERMIRIVNSLLNISRVESGQVVINPEPIDLGKLVQEILAQFKQQVEQQQVNLIVSIHQDLPPVNVDPKLVAKVYANLLSNAIKYTPKGGDIQVFISRKNDEIISQIADTGFGIPKQQHEKVFEKFFRGENTAKFETDGTGLSLYLTKAIVDFSGGRIWFESEEGKGTTFWFSLPVTGMTPKKGAVTLD
jgi:signal transduction histidine kinase